MEIVGCGNYTIEAVKLWLANGGRRLDAADSCAWSIVHRRSYLVAAL